MLFKYRDEKRIFGIMNFQKKCRNGNEKRIFKRIWWFLKMSPSFGTKLPKPSTKNLSNWHLFRIPHDQNQPFFMEKFLKLSDVKDKK